MQELLEAVCKMHLLIFKQVTSRNASNGAEIARLAVPRRLI
jgi:hypothetical protein